MISIEKTNYSLVTMNDCEMCTFLCELFGPFIDSLWLSASTLNALKDSRNGVMERMLVEQAQWLGEKCYFGRVMNYFDATAKESIRSAFKVFLRQDFLEMDPDSTYLSLSPRVKADTNILDNLINEIGAFRRPIHTLNVAARL